MDTTLARYKQVGLAPDSQQYMAPAHKWFDGSVHHHSEQLLASPFKVVETGEFDLVSHEKGCIKIT